MADVSPIASRGRNQEDNGVTETMAGGLELGRERHEEKELRKAADSETRQEIDRPHDKGRHIADHQAEQNRKLLGLPLASTWKIRHDTKAIDPSAITRRAEIGRAAAAAERSGAHVEQRNPIEVTTTAATIGEMSVASIWRKGPARPR